MREIKFRVWDKTRKKLFQVVSIDFILERVEVWVSGIATFLSFNEIELMQYTGLKDKNGVEIYEGTVLKYDAPSKYKNLQTKHLVSFSDGRFDWKNDDYVLCHSTINYKDGYVVSGNIHDNPELLEVAK